MNVTDKITITNEDNMQLMSRYPDKYFELAIVDPPYGIGIETSGTHFKKNKAKGWDNETPTKDYFNELKRVSKNQIIWGGNYFFDELGNTKTFLIWDKKIAEGMSFAMCELAWTSFKNGAKIFKETATQIERIHPTQKPVALYKWILDKYAKPNDKILDTHLGSGSIAIACHDYGFELTACELDSEYYEKAIQRIKNHTNQTNLFL
jgi:site-specific DNA-methyltransferase (adenine-specific)